MVNNPKNEEEEEDQVTAAYENISKKLESLRKGKEEPEEPGTTQKDSEKESEEEDEAGEPPKPTFTPKKDDPLDDEDTSKEEAPQPDEAEVDEFEESEEKVEIKEDKKEEVEDQREGWDKKTVSGYAFSKPEPKEHDLDDLAEEPVERPTPTNDFSNSLSDFGPDEESIPNLRPRQENAFGTKIWP